MHKSLWMSIMAGAVVVSLISCMSLEKQVQPTSPDEKAIYQLFADMQTAWNRQDAATYITFWHDDLNLKLGSMQKASIFYKARVCEVIAAKNGRFRPFQMDDPKILMLEGNKAKASVIVSKQQRDFENVFTLVRVNGRWQIISNEW
jgi:hypothetical protein